MPEWWTTFIGPAAPILAAILGACIAAAVTYGLIHKRKRIVFLIGKTESLTDLLKARGGELVKLSIDKQELGSLNRAEIRAVNSGNTSIPSCSFEVMLPGKHDFIRPSLKASSLLLETAMLIRASSVPQCTAIKLSMPFFNPQESIELVVFFDGSLIEPEILCRIEDVRYKSRRGLNIDSFLDDFTPNSVWGAVGRGVLRAMINK